MITRRIDEQATDMRVSVCICTRHRPQLLQACLHALLHHDASWPWELIIVDDGPSAETAVVATQWRDISGIPSVYVISAGRGLSYARNLGARAARGRIIAYLDDDALPADGWLRAIGGEWPAGALVAGGPIDIGWRAPRPPWLPDALLGYLTALDLGGSDRPFPSDAYPYGANIAFRRDALLSVGGFDECLGRQSGRPLSLEERDLVARLRDRGAVAAYLADARVTHAAPAERLTRGYFRERAWWQGMSEAIWWDRRGAGHRSALIARRLGLSCWYAGRAVMWRASHWRRQPDWALYHEVRARRHLGCAWGALKRAGS